VPLALLLGLTRARWLAECTPATLWRAFAGGAPTLVAYTLIVWAMTVASIPEVAALRETAILFGAAISILVLKEEARLLRVASACIIAAGAAAIRFT
jgi:drug/metabolite transporter (DMT)-like permease